MALHCHRVLQRTWPKSTNVLTPQQQWLRRPKRGFLVVESFSSGSSSTVHNGMSMSSRSSHSYIRDDFVAKPPWIHIHQVFRDNASHLLVDPCTQQWRVPVWDHGKDSVHRQPPENWRNLSWKDYLLMRGFLDRHSFAKASTKEQQAAVYVWSTFLSFPLTLAHYWDSILIIRSEDKPHVKVCIVGAHVELYHAPIWNELVWLVNYNDHYSLSLDFVGTALQIPGHNNTNKFNERSCCTLPTWAGKRGRIKIKAIRGRVEEYVLIGGKRPDPDDDEEEEDNDDYDIFVAFQPGPGTNSQYTWQEGFEVILETGKPLLLTAYDEKDAYKDAYWWEYTFGISLGSYQSNPWAASSLGQYPFINGMVAIHNGPPSKRSHGSSAQT